MDKDALVISIQVGRTQEWPARRKKNLHSFKGTPDSLK